MKKTFFLLVALIMFVSVSFASTKREKVAENKKMKTNSPLEKKVGSSILKRSKLISL